MCVSKDGDFFPQDQIDFEMMDEEIFDTFSMFDEEEEEEDEEWAEAFALFDGDEF